MRTEDLIAQAASLPVKERATIVDALLDSLNPLRPDTTETEWAAVAKRRLAELRSGKVKGIPGDQVFEGIGSRRSNHQ